MKSFCALLCLTVIFYLTGKSIPESGGVLNPVSNPTGTFTDSRDGKTYKTVKIGNQWWMAENLAYLPAVSQVTSGSSTEKHYYVFGYDGTSVGG